MRNGTLNNGLTKLLEGYHIGRDTEISTCYNWVGRFLSVNPGYDNETTVIRFWGVRRATIEQSLIVHGDAIAEDATGPILISDSRSADYTKMQLVVEYRWTELKNYFELRNE